jgi:Asp-tRNA(Asn)/Glu-tRNA(Gln) amidotransferase A subunit family amidase
MNTSASPVARDLRRASMCQQLHWLAIGRTSPQQLADACMEAIGRLNPVLHAFIDVRPALVQDQVVGAGKRREKGLIGRLDGIPVAIKDNIDMAGWPTRAGMPGRDDSEAMHDAHVVSRLRAAGAVLLGKTNMDEGALGAVTDNPHTGATHNPFRVDCSAGGSSGGAAAAVASGMASVAIGTDSLGSIRIPASYCGLFALKPTHGEISTRGVVPAARRLDAIGLLARGVDDLTVLLQVLAGYDADDPRSRHRRVAFSLPDWEPGNLRTGLLPDLRALGVEPEVADIFEKALESLPFELGKRRPVDFSDWDFARTRRAGLLLMESEMLGTFAADLEDAAHPVSDAFRAMLDHAGRCSAADYANADRVLDAAALKMRRLFAQVDVLVLPTTPQSAFALDAPVPANQADLTSFASLAACPAVSIPMGRTSEGLPVGLQFVGPRGSDLRLLELAQVCAASLDAAPEYPIEPASDG